jgi:hypothetical protein
MAYRAQRRELFELAAEIIAGQQDITAAPDPTHPIPRTRAHQLLIDSLRLIVIVSCFHRIFLLMLLLLLLLRGSPHIHLLSVRCCVCLCAWACARGHVHASIRSPRLQITRSQSSHVDR